MAAMLEWFSEASTRASRSKRASRFRIPHQSLRQDLDRHIPVEPAASSAIHLAHAAGPDRRQDLVGAEARTGRERHAVDDCIIVTA